MHIRTPTRPYRLFLELKRTNIGYVTADGVVARAKKHPENPWILFAPYIPRPMGEYLAAAGINFVDEVGNCRLELGTDHVAVIEGRKRAKPNEAGQATGPAAIEVTFAFLAEPDLLNAPVREIAERVGIGKTAVAGAIRKLIRQGLITANKPRRVLRRKELLDRWLIGYETIVRPRRMVGRYKTMEADPLRLERRIEDLLEDAEIKWGWGGGAAAMRLTGFYRGAETVLAVHQAPDRGLLQGASCPPGSRRKPHGSESRRGPGLRRGPGAHRSSSIGVCGTSLRRRRARPRGSRGDPSPLSGATRVSFLTAHQASALRTLRETWDEDEIVIIGAAALRYHLGHEWRETHDLDLSIATSVERHAAVLADLPGWARDSRMEQTWMAPDDVRIDIIPVSVESMAAGVLVWPESEFRMSLTGFGLAFAHGESTEVAAGVSVLVASLPAIVVLKMAAFLDRPAERERDLVDLAVILERAVSPDDEDRYADQVFDADLSYEEAGPFVLGRRVAAAVGERDRQLVSDFLRNAEDPDAPPFVLERLSALGPTDVASGCGGSTQAVGGVHATDLMRMARSHQTPTLPPCVLRDPLLVFARDQPAGPTEAVAVLWSVDTIGSRYA